MKQPSKVLALVLLAKTCLATSTASLSPAEAGLSQGIQVASGSILCLLRIWEASPLSFLCHTQSTEKGQRARGGMQGLG